MLRVVRTKAANKETNAPERIGMKVQKGRLKQMRKDLKGKRATTNSSSSQYDLSITGIQWELTAAETVIKFCK